MQNQIMEWIQIFVQYKQPKGNAEDQEMQQDDDTQEEMTAAEIEKIPANILKQLKGSYDSSA